MLCIVTLSLLQFCSVQREQWDRFHFAMLLDGIDGNKNTNFLDVRSQNIHEILLFSIPIDHSGSKYLSTKNLPAMHKSKRPHDYGGLEFTSLHDAASFKRKINRHDTELYSKWKNHQLEAMSDTEHEWDGENVGIVDKGGCAPPEFTRLYYPTCNSFHEIDYGRQDQGLDIHLLSTSGYYREPWLFQADDGSSFVSKRTKLNDRRLFDYRDLVNTHRDALVMERLSSSPHIMDIYDYCGGTVHIEALHDKAEEVIYGDGRRGSYSYPGHERRYDTNKVIRSQNNLSPHNKLTMALEMAQSLVNLHNFTEGTIVHNDVAVVQWMIDANGYTKLGDFNRVEFLSRHAKTGKNCEYYSGTVYGVRRSPEEYKKDQLEEKVDVYSLGNVFYSILTGLRQYFEESHDSISQKRIQRGKLPRFDVDVYRSFEEKEIAKAMYKCWETKPKNRASLFEIIQDLEAAMEKSSHISTNTEEEQGEEQPNRGSESLRRRRHLR